MSYEGKDFLGLAYFGQSIIHLIDSGKSASLSAILKEMEEGHLVDYILENYNVRFMPNSYNIPALNYFFQNLSPYAESSKSGVFSESNGLLTILSIILTETETQIVNWS